LIFGAQGETLDDWQADIRQAAAMPVNHISAYCLEFESATSCCAGNLTDKELEKRANDAEFFETAMNLLPELGFEQYEISNYARSKSARCLHNLSTWNMAQWLGLGAAAASQWRGIRRRNSSDFIKWRNGVLDGLPNYEDIVALDDEELFSSALIFGLRMSDGVNFNSIKKRFPKANSQKYHDAIMGLCAQGMMTICDDSTVKLTRQGTLMADAIAVELL